MPMRILVTGFEPFGAHAVNSSMAVVNALPRSNGLITRILPVLYEESGSTIRELIETERPDAVMCLGLCARSPSILLERIAVNVNENLTGDRMKDSLIDTAGPVGYWSTLPLSAMHLALREKGVPVASSNHAGTYVCNHVFYTACRTVERLGGERLGGERPCGFVHLPPVGEGGLPLPTLVEAVRTCIDVIELNLAGK
jgi:pyroglutamyl-peptidase